MVETFKNGSVEPKTIEKPVVNEDVTRIKKLAGEFMKNAGYLPEDFFATVLIPIHDNSFEPLSKEAKEEIFTLSGKVPEKDRKNMAVYPAEEGNIMILNMGWHASLEQWRMTCQNEKKQNSTST